MTTNENDLVSRFFNWFKRYWFTAVIMIGGIVIIAFGDLLGALNQIDAFLDPVPTMTPRGIQAFTGEIGQLEQGKAFYDFIDNNRGKIVRLDAFIREGQFHGQVGGEEPYLIVWIGCNSSDGPLDNSNCLGYYYRFDSEGEHTDYVYDYGNFAIQLQGYFLVRTATTTSDGYIYYTLKPLNSEDVLLNIGP